MEHRLADIPEKEPAKGFHGKYIHTENTTIGVVEIDEGSILPEHSHPHEQTTIVTEGRLELTIDGETQVFYPGLVAHVPGDVKHSGKAITNCKVIDVFYPVREDYK